MPHPTHQTLIFDLESDGLLDSMTTMHNLCMREYETGQAWTFRNNNKENNIEEGVEMLMNAEMIVGHNIAAFDIPAIQLIYDWFEPDGVVRDTLVMSRLIFTDQKDKDFRLWKRKKLPGQLIGASTLKAWGYRLGLQKGDYMDDKIAEAKEAGLTDDAEIMRYVWSSWNQEMEDYCELDVDVTTKLWKMILDAKYPEFPIEFEHDCHDMATMIEENGWPFDVKRAEEMSDSLEEEVGELSEEVIDEFGTWFAPAKKRIISPLWNDPEGKNAKKKYEDPRPEFFEDNSRKIWAEVTVAKSTRKFKKMYRENKKTGVKSLNNSVEEGAMFCAIKQKDFNPGSRHHIIDRFTTLHQWEPIDFTETGQPSVSDVVLKSLVKKIPIAEQLSEIFYLKKRLSQVKTGAQAWLKHVKDDGAIHHRLNVGGTISGRCAHSSPNIAQVPKVMANKEGVLKGRAGRHGWDSRRLFYVPEGWKLVGCDLSGIELRCLANLTAPYDNGALIREILEGDIHTTNQEAAGLETRDQAKTFIYATIYGAGNEKIGSIALPDGTPEEQAAMGKELKARFYAKLPGLDKVMRLMKKQSRRGWIEGLDGRRLIVRASHAALNLKLQNDAAMLAKKWMLLADDQFLDDGFTHGWNGDYAFLGFIHDELQVAVKDDLVDYGKETLIAAAGKSGEFFNFAMPVDAEAKHGINWSETH